MTAATEIRLLRLLSLAACLLLLGLGRQEAALVFVAGWAIFAAAGLILRGIEEGRR